MVKINPQFNFGKFQVSGANANPVKAFKEVPPADSENLDTVSLSKDKTEKFEDVYNEMINNIPDRTNNIKDKLRAIVYIDRMLNCPDITPELKNYWENKKDILMMEIQNIKNERALNTNETDYNKIAAEWRTFTDKYWNKQPVFENVPDRVEYYRSYYNTYISFCNRMLACDNLPDDMRAEWTRMRQNALFDLNNHMRDLNNYNREHGQQTERFDDVFNEMRQNVPDSTTTKDEKNLAISYINRMLSCDDIPNAEYWQNKKAQIEAELQRM